MAVPAAGLVDGGSRVDPTDVPMLVCITLDRTARERLVALGEHVGVLVFAPDLETAHALLGRELDAEHAPTGDDRAGNVGVIAVGDLEVDAVHCRVRWRGRDLPMSRRERDLLVQLAGDPTRVCSYEQLHAAGWPDAYLDPGPVHAAIKRLRRKLREAGVEVKIESVRGVGYQLVPDGEWPLRREVA